MTHLSDPQLLARLEALSERERTTTLNILLHLGEVERRKLHLSLGYGSLFDFATKHLRYSASAAGRRIQAARCIQRHPEVAALFRSREVNLSTISLACRILNDANKKQLLDQIRNKSQREVEVIVAAYSPATRLRDRVKPVYLRAPDPRGATVDRGVRTGNDSRSGSAGSSGSARVYGSAGLTDNAGFDGSASTDGAFGAVAVGSSRGDMKGLSETPMESLASPEFALLAPGSAPQEVPLQVEQKYVIQFAAQPAFLQMFEEARAILSRRFPRGVSFARVFEAALETFLEHNSPVRREARRQLRKERGTRSKAKDKKRGVTETGSRVAENPAGKNPAEMLRCASVSARHIPLALRDVVFARDEGRCTYVGTTGRRCQSKHNLEIDHVIPFARGGASCAENLRLLCAAHNRLEAERVYGSDWMQQFQRRE